MYVASDTIQDSSFEKNEKSDTVGFLLLQSFFQCSHNCFKKEVFSFLNLKSFSLFCVLLIITQIPDSCFFTPHDLPTNENYHSSPPWFSRTFVLAISRNTVDSTQRSSRPIIFDRALKTDKKQKKKEILSSTQRSCKTKFNW